MKNSKEIKSFILKKGNKLTNAEMVTKLGVPTMTFAGVLAAMKRKGEVSNDFLKSDVTKANKTTKKHYILPFVHLEPVDRVPQKTPDSPEAVQQR